MDRTWAHLSGQVRAQPHPVRSDNAGMLNRLRATTGWAVNSARTTASNAYYVSTHPVSSAIGVARNTATSALNAATGPASSVLNTARAAANAVYNEVDNFGPVTKDMEDAYQAAVQDEDSPGAIDDREATDLILTSRDVDASRSYLGVLVSNRGRTDLARLRAGHGPQFLPDAAARVDRYLKAGVVSAESTARPDRTIIDWTCKKPTWCCHWYPMEETYPDRDDPVNNLFAKGGACDKYDQAFGARSRAYEYAHNRIPSGTDREDSGWAGHCNNACEAVSLLKEPAKPVVYKGIEFTPWDIKGLLVLISDRLASRVDFRGHRYNGPTDDPNDPSPEVVVKTLKQWTKDDLPFILDIDREEAVWNYPYDKAKVVESYTPPEGFDTGTLPKGGTTRYYTFDLSGTGFEEEARHYQGWMHIAEDGKVTSNWIAGADEKISPDFMWRAHPVAGAWRGAASSNPEVLAANVWKLYTKSIA